MVSLPVASLAAFNLLCTGTHSVKSLTLEKTEPYEIEYRVELDAERWCEGDCEQPRDFYSVEETQLTLQYKKEDTPFGSELLTNTINRRDGKHTILVTSRRRSAASIIILKWDGQCEQRPFTGFPEVSTKF